MKLLEASLMKRYFTSFFVTLLLVHLKGLAFLAVLGETQEIECGAGQGLFEIEVLFLGSNPNNFNIAITRNLGADADASKFYILNLSEQDIGTTVTRSGCFDSHRLQRFDVYDADNHAANTSYRLLVNRREITLRPRRQDVEEYYFFGDEQSCAEGGGRFQLEVRFDDWPEEIEWELQRIDGDGNEEVVLSYENIVKFDNSSYSPDFNSNSLLVDYCIKGGIYQFQFVDHVVGETHWQVSINDWFIQEGRGLPGERATTLSYSAISGDIGIGPTPAPLVVTDSPRVQPETSPTFSSETRASTTAPFVKADSPDFQPETSAPFSSGTPVSPPAPFEQTDSPHFQPETSPPFPPANLLTSGPHFRPETSPPLSSGTPISFPKPNPKLPICLSGGTAVLVQHVGGVQMQHLQIGDAIAVGNGNYERIYSFGHFEPDGIGSGSDFLQIRSQDGAVVRVSKHHLLFVRLVQKSHDRSPSQIVAVPALSIRVGDELACEPVDTIDRSTCRNQVVESIQPIVVTDGLYSPFTPSGKFLVVSSTVKNQTTDLYPILVSSYVGFGISHDLKIGFGVAFSFQWLAQTFEFPHRMFCHFFWTRCKEETYDEHGLSVWVAQPFKAAVRVLQIQDPFLRSSALLLLVGMLSLFWLLEKIYLLSFLVGTLFILSRMSMRLGITIKKLKNNAATEKHLDAQIATKRKGQEEAE